MIIILKKGFKIDNILYLINLFRANVSYICAKKQNV